MKTSLLYIFLSLLAGCAKLDLPSGTPVCIEEEIAKLKSEKVKNPPGSIWRYTYRGQTVYYIPQYCCDIPSRLLDSNCNSICSPDGGITGKGDGQCSDFFEVRKDEKLIWQDNRK